MVAGEPHAAGEILAMWFESQCGLRAADGPIRTATDVKAGHCMWLNLLQGFEYAELRYSDDRQVTLARPAMLMRMDAAIKAVANWAQPPERVYFHHDGGMPTMFEAVADALAFRLPDADLLVQRRDRGGIDTATRPYPGLRPGESLRQRAAARELVDSGRFADAALLARAMQSRVAKRERWVYQLRRVSDWLRGIATADPARGSIAGTGHSDIVDAVMDGWHIMDALKGSAGEAVHSWLTTALSAEAAAQAGDAAELTQLLCTMADAVHERILVPVAPTRAEVRDMPAREARLQDLKRWSKPKWWGARLAAMACAYANAVDQRTRTGRQDSLRDLRNQLLHEGRAQRTMDDLRPALRRAGVHIDAAGLRVLKPGSPVHNVGLALGVDLAASYTVLLHATRSEVEHIEYSWWGEP
ncbi:MAG: hypothetical protein FJ100_18265 [Deltaproteobacteria bacterium]|nr:hypothetical protein [Deltaproteobacteria bacterium]